MPVARSNGSQTSYLGKLAAYREIITREAHKSHWGLPNLLVLTVTVSEVRVSEIVSGLRERAGGSMAFLFKAVGTPDLTAPAPQLLFEPWQRAGFPPLRIADASAPT